MDTSGLDPFMYSQICGWMGDIFNIDDYNNFSLGNEFSSLS
jgi:hypothetical protein